MSATTDFLTIEPPSGIVRATAGPRHTDAVVFELHGAMRGSVHVTGTQHPRHWDQFTAVRACLGPVDAFETTAPDDALPRLAHDRQRLPRQPDPLPPRVQRPPRGVRLPAVDRRRERSVAEDGRNAHRRSAGVRPQRRPARRPAPDPRCVQAAQNTRPAAVPQLGRHTRRRRPLRGRVAGRCRELKATVALWWTIARMFTARADKYRGEVASLRAQQQRGRRGGAQAHPGTKEKV